MIEIQKRKNLVAMQQQVLYFARLADKVNLQEKTLAEHSKRLDKLEEKDKL